MKLQELLAGVAVKSNAAAADTEIREVRYDSRAVQPGDLFVAIRGYATDGHKYIAKALEQGAAAIVCEEAPAAHRPWSWKTPAARWPRSRPTASAIRRTAWSCSA